MKWLIAPVNHIVPLAQVVCSVAARGLAHLARRGEWFRLALVCCMVIRV